MSWIHRTTIFHLGRHILGVGSALASDSGHRSVEALVVLDALESAAARRLGLLGGVNLGRLSANLSCASESSVHLSC